MMQVLLPLAVLFAMPGAAGGETPRLHPQPQSPPVATAPAPRPAVTPAAAPAPAPADPLDAAPRISAVDAKKAMDGGNAILLDVRGFDVFEMEHAKGAVSLPVNEILTRMKELPKGKQIIAYCT